MKVNYVRQEYANFLKTSKMFKSIFVRGQGEQSDGFTTEAITEVMKSVAIDQRQAVLLSTDEFVGGLVTGK